MADELSGNAARAAAADALLSRVREAAGEEDHYTAKQYAIAYRLIMGGAQPGGSVIEPK